MKNNTNINFLANNVLTEQNNCNNADLSNTISFNDNNGTNLLSYRVHGNVLLTNLEITNYMIDECKWFYCGNNEILW